MKADTRTPAGWQDIASAPKDGLSLRCWRFVEDQSEGEWGDDLIAKDAAKLEAFVRAEFAPPAKENNDG